MKNRIQEQFEKDTPSIQGCDADEYILTYCAYLEHRIETLTESTKTYTGEQGIENMKADLREIIEACGEWEDFDIVLREVLDDLDREAWEREQEGRMKGV